MTPKQQRFVEEYLIDLNATQAAIRAGYSAKTAHAIGDENLRKPEIKSAIVQAQKDRSKRTEITQDRVLQEIAKLAFSRYSNYIRIDGDGHPVIDLSGCTPDDLDALVETSTETVWEKSGEDLRPIRKVKIKVADKGKYLELLGKHLGIVTEKVEHSGSIDTSGLTDEERAARIAAILERGRQART